MSNVLPLRCEKCNYEWEEAFVVPMHFKSFLKRLDLLCPKCGAKPKYIVIKTEKAEQALTEGE